MLERNLILFCAPTLASIKTGSLFSCRFSSLQLFRCSVALYNELLREKGLELIELRLEQTRALLYLFRREQLSHDLHKAGVPAFLLQYGYQRADADAAIETLKRRLQESETFPHEIGLFLDYPLEDVRGFIQNGGKRCKCSGLWKVYGNEQAAQKRFCQFKKCREVYLRLWQSGSRSLVQLTVESRYA